MPATETLAVIERRFEAGERISYGLRYRFDRDSTVATVPIGYADGLPRRLSATGGHVIIRGKLRPIAGTVTMDQITVDCGDDHVEAGDEVVLLGRQGDAEITAVPWATWEVLRRGTDVATLVVLLTGRPGMFAGASTDGDAAVGATPPTDGSGDDRDAFRRSPNRASTKAPRYCCIVWGSLSHMRKGGAAIMA